MLMGGACALAICSPATAQTRTFNVPAGELRTALGAYARQAGVQLIYRTDDIRGARTGGARGALTAEAALEQVLRGTGFRVRRDASGAIAIVRAGLPRPPPPARPPPPRPAPPPPPPVFVTPDGQLVDPNAETEVEPLIVTGSRLPNPNLESIRPVTAVTAEEIRQQGATRVEDVVRALPQAYAGQGSEVSNGATGTATVDLRNLGPSRTLVLIDGRRMVPGDPTLPVADINFIPAQLIDRIDVVTGGASAVYGADAVAGVVNFIMVKGFQGVRLDAQYSVNQHQNDNAIAKTMREFGISPPEGNVVDGGVVDLTGVIGINTPDARGGAVVYATYRATQPVTLGQRDFSACPLDAQGPSKAFFCTGSGAAFPARVISFDRLAADLPGDLLVDNGGFRRFRAPDDLFNFAPYNYFQRPDERYTLGAFAHYELSPNADAYTQLMFMDDRTRASLAPSAIFGQTIRMPCASPLLSAAQVATLCTDVGLGPEDVTNLLLFRRNVEGDPRQDDLRHTDYRIVAGLRGDLGRGWSYDVYGQYSAVVFSEMFLADFSRSRTPLALDVVRHPVTGKLVCRSALDPNTAISLRGCQPYDIFSPAGPSPESVRYLQTNGFANGSTAEQVVSGQVTGNLTEYGIISPWANDGIAVAFGAEYRRELLAINYSPEFRTGDLAGQGGPLQSVEGAFDVAEAFGEARVPIVDRRPLLESLAVEVGLRHADYSSFGRTNTYKIGLEWAPVEDLRLRAGYNRAVRAPNILELFTPSQIRPGLRNDPCAGPTPRLGPSECANTGVSPEQYGQVPANPGGMYNVLAGGNTELRPETSNSWSLGFVTAPKLLPGFNVSLDYFDIKLKDAIGELDPDFLLITCATGGDPDLCAQIERDPQTGSLFTGGGFVRNTTLNVGHIRTSGIDVAANYRPPLAEWGVDNIGSVDIAFVGTWLAKMEIAPGLPAPSDPTVNSFDCAGLYGAGACGPPNPRWRHRLRVNWNTPWDGLSLLATWRHFGGVTNQNAGSDNPYFDNTPTPGADLRLPAEDYFDLAATWRVLDNFTLRAGVNNLFDNDPPLVGQTLGGADFRYGGNSYPAIYQSLGRYVFFGVTADF